MLAEGKGTSADLDWALSWRWRWRWGQQAIRDGANLGVLVSDGRSLRFYHQSLHGYFAVEPLGRALTIRGGFDEFTKNPVGLTAQIGDLDAAGAPAIEPIIKSLRDAYLALRQSSGEPLWSSTDVEVDPLIEFIMEMRIRRSSAQALRQIGDAAVDWLNNALGDKDEDIRREAAWMLQQIGTPEALAALEKYRQDYPNG